MTKLVPMGANLVGSKGRIYASCHLSLDWDTFGTPLGTALVSESNFSLRIAIQTKNSLKSVYLIQKA